MDNKLIKGCLLVLVAIVIFGAGFVSGAVVGSILPNNPLRDALGINETAGTPAVTDPNTSVPTLEGGTSATQTAPDYSQRSPSELKELFAPFWESWDLLHENYVDQPLDDVTLMRGAISGMLAATGDKHTSYMDPDQFKQANTSMEGEYEGIGAWVDITGEYVEIISPMKGSPAEAAGLKANDIVIAVNGVDMTGTPGDLVLKQILGPAGEKVVLTIRRGEETFDVSIIREKITIPVVDYEMREDGIGYVALYTFNDTATKQLRNALDDLMAQKPKGLILDLRDNGGGYLSTAIEVVSEFIEKGVVMYEEYGDGSRDSYKALGGGRATEIPLVVLVNEGTASASEITAGAIQDLGRGKLVGVKTYGKGSVQSWISLKSEDSGVRITIARWLTPNGRQISDVGLTPDVIVEYTQADADAGIDPQLEAAVNLLLGK